MQVYLASRYSRKLELREYAAEARASYIGVISRWLEEDDDPNGTLDKVSTVQLMEYAKQDIDDIDKADILVFFAEDPLVGVPRGGRHVEFGYALGAGKPIVVIGKPENVFHYLPASYATIEFFETWESALQYLRTQ